MVLCAKPLKEIIMKKNKVLMLLAVSIMSCLVLSGCMSSNVNPEAVEKAAEAFAEEAEKAGETLAEDMQGAADAFEKDMLEAAEEFEKEMADAVGDDDKEKSDEPEEAEEELEAEFTADRKRVFDLLSNINVGWNLGNTLDAWGAGNTVDSETYWANVKTTQEIIDTVKNQGFNAIRIPVTYGEHLGSAPDYKIDPAWLDRIQEIVDYAVNDDMYIIIDTHHETNQWLVTDPANSEALNQELSAIWLQVAERFKDYDEKLIFEGMNEPRTVGSAQEWNGGTPEERVLINEMNKSFVDTVRSTGGNNETRVLIICPYGNNCGMKAIRELEIPNDNNIAVAVHMYTPYVFTYVPNGQKSLETWDGSKKAEIVNTIKLLDETFIQNDVPVIVTEFGAENKGHDEEVVKWLDDYLGFMNKYGIKCFWWDNGFFGEGNENFAILERPTLTFRRKEVADELVKLGNEN